MNAENTQAMQAYKSVDVDTRFMAASPHQLIMMLFDGALAALAQAKVNMLHRDIPGQGTAISKAIMIVDDGLKASLDEKTGGKIAHDLKVLYEYMTLRLLSANLKSDPAILDEVSGLLYEVSSAWREIGKSSAPNSNAVPSGVAPGMPPGMPKDAFDQPPPSRPTMSYGKA